MLKRIFLLCLCFVLLILNACSNENSDENERQTGENGDTATDESAQNGEGESIPVLTDDLPDDLDFGGSEIKILSRGHFRFQDDITVEELDGEVVNDAIFQRAKLVEDRLNINIVNIQSEEGGIHGPHERMQKVARAGTHEYDVFTASSYTTAPLGVQGIFYNLYDIEHIDLNKPYWMQGYIENSQIGSKLFTISGDILLSTIRSSFVVFFNHRLLKEYSLEDPYQLVRGGKWTIDKFAETVKNIYRDLNGDGIKDMDDFFGLGTSNYINIDAYTSSFALHNILFDENHYPYLNPNNEKFASATQTIYNLNWNQQGVFAHGPEHEDAEMDRIYKYFGQGNYIFAQNWLRGTENMYLRDMQDDYGILPYPKYDEIQQDYYTFLHDQFGAIAIPTTVVDTELVGAFLEAFASESRKSVFPAYYDIALKRKYTRDYESADMIDIIHNGVVLDMSWIYGAMMDGLPQILRNLLHQGNSEYISTFEKSETRYTRIIEKLIGNVQELE